MDYTLAQAREKREPKEECFMGRSSYTRYYLMMLGFSRFPEVLPDDRQREVIDFIQFLKSKRQRQKPYDGKQLLSLFKEGRQYHLFSDIKDPAAWQKEIRIDRPLPGRD